MSVESLILFSQRPEVKKSFLQQMCLGVQFFDYLSAVLNRFEPGVEAGVRKYLAQRLEKYKEYASILNDPVDLAYNVSTEKLDSMLANLTQNRDEAETNIKKVSE